MSDPTTHPLRVLFCFGINQNFFDLPESGISTGDVWTATVELIDGLKSLPGLEFIADFDDDSHMVGPSSTWPWTFYVLADVDGQETVKDGCNLLRTITLGESRWKLWRFMTVEARMGRSLIPRSY